MADSLTWGWAELRFSNLTWSDGIVNHKMSVSSCFNHFHAQYAFHCTFVDRG
jgi:hypothetical protein